MANLYVLYWGGLADSTPGGVSAQVPTGLKRTDTLAISGTNAVTSTAAPGCSILQLMAEADCMVSYGTAPNAGTDALKIPLFAGVPQFIGRPADVGELKVAVITRVVA